MLEIFSIYRHKVTKFFSEFINYDAKIICFIDHKITYNLTLSLVIRLLISISKL